MRNADGMTEEGDDTVERPRNESPPPLPKGLLERTGASTVVYDQSQQRTPDGWIRYAPAERPSQAAG